MNNRYEWDETIIDRAGLSLVARAWARFCPAKRKLAFALEPHKQLTKLRLWIGGAMGAVVGPVVNLMASAIMHLPWTWSLALVCLAAWAAGTLRVLSGAGRAKRKDVDQVMAALFPGQGRETLEVAKMTILADQVWALEILTQVAGVHNLARLEQHLMLDTVQEAVPSDQPTPVRRF